MTFFFKYSPFKQSIDRRKKNQSITPNQERIPMILSIKPHDNASKYRSYLVSVTTIEKVCHQRHYMAIVAACIYICDKFWQESLDCSANAKTVSWHLKTIEFWHSLHPGPPGSYIHRASRIQLYHTYTTCSLGAAASKRCNTLMITFILI